MASGITGQGFAQIANPNQPPRQMGARKEGRKGQKMAKTAYFGYSTYAEYASARLRTAHTKSLRDLWSQESQHDHDARIQREMVDSGRFIKIARSVREFLGENPKTGSFGWYFSHPVTVAAMPEDLAEWASRFHVKQPPIYG